MVRDLRKNEHLKAYMLIIPSLIFLLMFTVYPVFKSVYSSFFIDKLGVSEPIFCSVTNYKNLMEDEIFWKVIKNNLLFTGLAVPISMVLGLSLALLLNDSKMMKKVKGLGMLRTSFFYPTVIPMIAVANVWLFIYTPDFGILDKILYFLNITPLNWLGDENVVLVATIIMYVWKEVGFLMIFYLAGLQTVPDDLYEAATIDRANWWHKLKYITLPMISHTSLFVSVIALTNSFKMVDHIEIMTGGGPNNASNLLLYYIYQVSFNYWDNGKAAALTVVMLLMLLTITSIRFFRREKKIFYG